ncbi:unnamed protein product [Fraxinus pennsylvanica]|uniref:Uncharacterized protein n=1 Tax=Fraxinus pennsylvanica TaxID=56036 RepID=A0AAD2EDY4_9LAMI|nr:unnamed protein product [Fraxinus pennsylvanica]
MIKEKGIKPLLLKDYLLDDFSSCSSNGFKSFPRRQCCSTVRFLIDIDLKNKKNPPPLLKNPSKSASSKALNSAFQCIINAVKHLPLAAKSSAAAQKKLKKSILPRSLSKKILKKSFWKRTSSHREIERWNSLDHLVKEKTEPLSSASDSNDGKSKTNSWSDSDFTASASDDSSQFSTKVPHDVVHEKVVVALSNDDVSMDSITTSEASARTNSSQTKVSC